MSDHSELNRLAEAATPGPWAYDGSYVCPARTEDGTTYVELWRSIADCHHPENTKFIAAANPTAVLALIAEVEGLRKLAPSKEIIWCACGDGYPVNSYGAGFMDANNGVCANCDAAMNKGEQP